MSLTHKHTHPLCVNVVQSILCHYVTAYWPITIHQCAWVAQSHYRTCCSLRQNEADENTPKPAAWKAARVLLLCDSDVRESRRKKVLPSKIYTVLCESVCVCVCVCVLCSHGCLCKLLFCCLYKRKCDDSPAAEQTLMSPFKHWAVTLLPSTLRQMQFNRLK